MQRPKGGGGGGSGSGGEASNDSGEGMDEFVFELSRKTSFSTFLFEDHEPYPISPSAS